MFQAFFQAFFSGLIQRGALTLHVGQRTWRFGEAEPRPDMDVVVRLKDGWTGVRLALNPWLEFGEAWMNGDLLVENGDAWSLLHLLGVNLQARPRPRRITRLTRVLKRLLPGTSRTASRRNVAHHYDLSDRLYRLFLDKDMQYSCAYFERPDMGLDAAQTAKKQHIAAKLHLRPGMSVLDIGCGWGGMALHLARAHHAEVTGITLSQEQFDVAHARAYAAHLEGQAAFEIRDYREVAGQFDRIVSVGMFEHVGPANFDVYFRTVADKLKDDGVALIHTIGRRSEFGGTNQWVNKYIFPGGYIPSLSEITRAVENAGLWITDVESLRLHYAETLKCWRERFMAHRDEVRGLYDERFCRMWEFYLAASEMSFRHGDLMVYQVQLARRVDALPIVRDYMMQPSTEPSVVDALKIRAGEAKKGVPGFAQPVRQGKARQEQRDRTPGVETR